MINNQKNKMKNIIKYFLLLLIFKSGLSYSQTIDYAYKQLDTPACNAFAHARAVDGFTHRTSLSRPVYNDNSIKLECKNNNSTSIFSTQYSINYNFKVGYNYKISVNYLGAKAASDGFFPSVGLKISTTNGGIDSGVNCTSASTFQTSNMADFTLGPSGSSYAWANNLVDVTITQNANYLLVGAFPWAGTSQNGFIWVRKIQIVETPPAGAFTISPGASSMTCGSTSPVTFTANNNNNITGITNYNWNLGTVPNGWLLPNGASAPATYSSGTTNTLTLTPDCGKALSNISVTITANGNNYNTNTSSVSISEPSYTITGTNVLCSGNTLYTLNGLVCNSIFNWTAPPSNLGSLSSLTTSPTTLTYGGTSGSFMLTANVTSCGVTTPVTLPVRVGSYTASDYTMTGGGSATQPLYWCPNQTYSFSISGAPASNYQWTIPSGWTQNYISNYLCVIKAPSSTSPPTGTVYVTFTEPCGTTISKSFFTAYSSSACTGTDPRFTYSPNPAPSYLYVAVASAYTSTTKIQRIQIISTTTGVTVFDQNYGTPGILSTYITTAGFQIGIHTLRIFDGSTWATYQFIR